MLFDSDDPTQAQIARPRMVDIGGSKRAMFKIDLVVESKVPEDVTDRLGADDGSRDDGPDNGESMEDRDHADSNATDGGSDDGQITFSLSDGPPEQE